MPRPAVPYETAVSFIEEFNAAHGKPPTVAAVIAEVGGSATTIARYKRRWQSERIPSASGGDRAGDRGGLAAGLPPALVETVVRGADALWGELIEGLAVQEQALEQEARARDAEVEKRVAASQAAEALARHECERLGAGLERTERTVDELRAALRVSELTRAEESSKLADALARVELLDAARTESRRSLEEAKERESRIRGEHRAALDRIEHAHRSQLERNRAELEEVETSRDALTTALAEQRAGLAAEQARSSALGAALEAARDEVRTLNEARAAALSESAHRAGTCEALGTALEARREEQAAAARAHRDERATWIAEHALLMQRLERLQSEMQTEGPAPRPSRQTGEATEESTGESPAKPGRGSTGESAD